MYKMPAPNGWIVLEEVYSPGDTARYVNDNTGGPRTAVEVGHDGRDGTWRVVVKEERGHMGWQRADVEDYSVSASNVTEDNAWDIARQEMERVGGSGRHKSTWAEDPEFDFF